jgi:hypothetical protein
MRYKRASLEIGVNTIVILVIAMMLLGLGIGFIRGLFVKANQLPGLIDTSTWQNPPTASDPIVLTPSSIEIKGGDSADVVVGVYNKEGSTKTFSVGIPSCTGGAKPDVQTLSASIASGDSKGFKVIILAVNASDSKQPKLPPQKYICKLQGAEVDQSNNPVTYDAQFIMTVTS